MEFKERKVLVLIRSKPFGKIINFEGWRAAVGMFGMDHQPTILFMSDGVYSLLKTMDERPIRMFKSTYEGFGGRVCASKKSLEERGINLGELVPGVEILDTLQVGQVLAQNEVVVTF
jgi:tRNA 2-thiouridine synthesizing protein C